MTIGDVNERLARGATTSRALCEEALARATDPGGEGSRTFTECYPEAARAAADAADALRRAGVVLSPLAGIPVSVKDLFDVAGYTTRAGSLVLADAPPATRDALAVARLRRAGAVVIGKTTMTEFAYSGLGINPHTGTPRNPWDRARGRIPGGSSSGAAVSLTDGMALVALGTDTGGSVRIPSALCGLVGFKPTARRIPLDGAYPLSSTLDSIGPLANSVLDCALADAVLSGSDERALAPPVPAERLRFLAPTNRVRDDCEPAVARAFEAALTRLRRAGATVEEASFPPLGLVPAVQAGGGFSAAEAYRRHRDLLAKDEERYDPQIARRIKNGAKLSAGDYLDLLQARAELIAAFAAESIDYDALLWPTVPVVAPPLDELLADDERYHAANVLILRNPSIANAADGCALSLPVHDPGTAPVGLMVVGRGDEDRRLLAIGRSIETLVRPAR